jgi:hypothetical protein
MVDASLLERLTANQAARLAEIVSAIAEANRPLVPTMAEMYFQRMVLRMAQHQLLFEAYEEGAA